MADNFTIKKTEGPVMIFHLSGKLDGQTNSALYDAASAAREGGARFLVLDLHEMEMITSAGLGTLQRIFRLFTPQAEIDAWDKEKHGEPYKSAYFKLAGAPSNIYYVLNIAGFLSSIPIYPDLESALSSFPK
jgi:anti-anti-sigma factor